MVPETLRFATKSERLSARSAAELERGRLHNFSNIARQMR